MQTISKTFTFDYAHRLKGADGNFYNKEKCGSLHGHTGKVIITVARKNFTGRRSNLEMEQDNFGFVMDYGLLSHIKNWIDDNWDHATLVENHDTELLNFLETSGDRHYVMTDRANSEAMVEVMLTQCTQLLPDFVKVVKLELWETPKSFCTWEDK